MDEALAKVKPLPKSRSTDQTDSTPPSDQYQTTVSFAVSQF